MDKDKLQVGQKVVVKIEETSNASRGLRMTLDNIDEWCFDGVITKIGRKYITVDFAKSAGVSFTEQFNIEDEYRQKYSCGGADYKLYPHKEAVIKELKTNKLYSYIRNKFSSYSNTEFTLEQLEKIYSILTK